MIWKTGSTFLLLAGLVACGRERHREPDFMVVDSESKAEAELYLPQANELRQIQRCEKLREANFHAADKSTEEGQLAVIAKLKAGTANPTRDAREAARAGEWGLIRSYTMMGSQAYGLECHTSNGMGHGEPLVRAYRVVSDAIGPCETFGAKGDCDLGDRLENYARVYNRALARMPTYPYRDLCRPSNDRAAGYFEQEHLDVASWGFRPAVDFAHPRTIHEAARRGNIAALERAVRRDRASINTPDPYQMTPLGWALAYKKPRAARWLVENGASPSGGDCVTSSSATSPLRIALATGQDEQAFFLSERLPDNGRTDGAWGRALISAAAEGGATEFLAHMLAEQNEGILAALSRRAEWHPDSAGIIAAHQRRLCWTHPLPKNVRVEVISAYSGRRGQPVQVFVARADQPIFVVLAAHDATEWHIGVAPQATLVGVVAIGLEWQRVRGVPEGTPLVRNWVSDLCGRLKSDGLYAGSAHGSEADALARNVRRLLGRPIDRMQASDVARQSYRLQ